MRVRLCLVLQQPLGYFGMQQEVKLHIVIIENPPRSVACLKLHAALMDAIRIHPPAWEVQSESRQVVPFGGPKSALE